MAEWDIIECGYNEADETINFGTRQLGDPENLYESSTVATIKSSAETVSIELSSIAIFDTNLNIF